MILDFTFVHTVTVTTFLGTGSHGDAWAAPVDVQCYVQDLVDIVRTADGSEQTSTSQLNAPLSTAPTNPPVAGQFALQSKVLTPSGRVARVMSAARNDSGALGLGLDHVHVRLT